MQAVSGRKSVEMERGKGDVEKVGRKKKEEGREEEQIGKRTKKKRRKKGGDRR